MHRWGDARHAHARVDHRFRELFPNAPVLVCSGYVDEELIGRGIAEGTVKALPKPFTGQELVAKVSALLARR